MITCACDPDTTTPAFAVFDERRLLEWRLLKGGMSSLLYDIQAQVEVWHPDLLLIENQYLPPTRDAMRRFRSVSRLVSARAMITAVFLLAGVECRLVEPFSWQRSLGGAGLGRDQLKKLSILKASDIAGQEIRDHNVADAINLGYWWVSTQMRALSRDQK